MTVDLIPFHWCDSRSPIDYVHHTFEPHEAPDGVLCFGHAVHKDGSLCHDYTTRLMVGDALAIPEPTVAEVLDELIEKCSKARQGLLGMRLEHDIESEKNRLSGKSEGVGLAESYIRDSKKIYCK